MKVLLTRPDQTHAYRFEVPTELIEHVSIVTHEGVTYVYQGVYDRGTLIIFVECQVLDTSTLS